MVDLYFRLMVKNGNLDMILSMLVGLMTLVKLIPKLLMHSLDCPLRACVVSFIGINQKALLFYDHVFLAGPPFVFHVGKLIDNGANVSHPPKVFVICLVCIASPLHSSSIL